MINKEQTLQPEYDSPEDKDPAKVKQQEDPAKAETSGSNTYRITVLKRLLEAQRVMVLRRRRRMKLHFLEKSWKNGELSFGVS